MPQVSRVRFEHHAEDAIGIGEAAPRISWSFVGHDRDWFQEFYEIRITKADDTIEHFRNKSVESALVAWPSRPLRSREIAFVAVRVSGNNGQMTEWSDTAVVEAGILDQKEWSCSVIEAPETNQPCRPVVFTKLIHIDRPVASSRMYITAHGIYTAHLNENHVGDHVLAPGWTNYSHRQVYQTFDLTEYLVSGNNTITATVAEGWYKGRLGWAEGRANIYGSTLGLIAMIYVDFVDGTTSLVTTDDTWQWTHGPHISAGLYDGEVYDARQSVGKDSHWRKVLSRPCQDNLCAPDGPPIRRVESLQPKKIIKSPSGKTIIDMGQNMVGWLRVKVQGPQGTEISFQFTEVLEQGEVTTRTLRAAKAKDTVILAGGDALQWEASFTFHGFRYVQVENWPGSLDVDSVTGIVIHSNMKRRGFFSCSNPLLNRLHENIVWSMKGNTVGIPTDCPQRDERLGWTGDINVFADTANFLYETAGFLKSWLKDVEVEQRQANGIVPLVVPNVIEGFDREAHAVWGDVAVMLPWSLYRSTGDSKFLADQFPSMEAWVAAIPRRECRLWDYEAQWKLGDWLDPAAPPDDPGNATTDPIYVSDAFLVHVTGLMKQISSILAYRSAQEKYAAAESHLRTEFVREYVTNNGLVAGCTQTAIALALHFDLLPTDNQVNHAADILSLIVRRNSRFKIATGFAGTPYIGHALTKTGQSNIFYRMLLGQENPSWLYPVTMGATTVWERWDSLLPDHTVNPGEMTSFNHYAFGAVAGWMHSTILGFRINEAGWRSFKIEPVPGGGLKWAEGEFLSNYGICGVKWRLEAEGADGETFHLEVRIPPNTTAEVRLPGAEIPLGVSSGVHSWVTKFTSDPWPPKSVLPPGHIDPFCESEEVLPCP
ncbi:bacterial alpha-L-rhamnosidase domain protein [Dactylonectria estremocensis]|uniref:alpha-L-rhamnosidase n=1 Tax=Dactylonectria estremocensis TaxID=1079267 RepID=A0A9P9DGU3_9HYPO|nr:bacterial alpha-L-rhamnosidase domain protein [Dactylonectria estremocensis]